MVNVVAPVGLVRLFVRAHTPARILTQVTRSACKLNAKVVWDERELGLPRFWKLCDRLFVVVHSYVLAYFRSNGMQCVLFWQRDK